VFSIFCELSECPDVKNYKWQLNPVWHRMLFSCTHMATVDVEGLSCYLSSGSQSVVGHSERIACVVCAMRWLMRHCQWSDCCSKISWRQPNRVDPFLFTVVARHSCSRQFYNTTVMLGWPQPSIVSRLALFATAPRQCWSFLHRPLLNNRCVTYGNARRPGLEADMCLKQYDVTTCHFSWLLVSLITMLRPSVHCPSSVSRNICIVAKRCVL